jgi:glycine oxidase
MVGVATALSCLRANLGSVALIEAGRLGSGATGGAAGLIMPEAHLGYDPMDFVELGRSSLQLWRELADSTPGGIGYQDMDWVGLAPLPDGFVADPPPDVEWLSTSDVAAIMPSLAGEASGAVVHHQGRVNPLRTVGRLAAQLPQVFTGAAASAVEVHNERILSVSTGGERITPGLVIFATGNPPVLPGLDLDVPADLVKGHLVATEPVAFTVPGSVFPLITQLDGGRLLLGGSIDAEDAGPAVNPDVIDVMRRDAIARLPQLEGARFSNQWCCWRPHHPDSLAVVDRVPGLENAWFTSGHYRTGILMAPVTGAIFTEWVTTGKQPERARIWGLEGRW